MPQSEIHRIGVLTSGGDAPGMNAAVRAVVRAATSHRCETIGVRYGYSGLVQGDFVPLGPRDVAGIIQRGGTILHTARCEAFLTPEGRAEAMEMIRAHGMDALVVVGGDGSFRGAQALAQEFDFPVAGIPGTIDNDIGGTEVTLGYDTAVNIAMDAIDRLRDTAASLDRIFVVEVMGRNCGALAVASAVAGGAEEIMIPEDPLDSERLEGSVRTALRRGKRSMIVVVAEGDESGGAQATARLLKSQLDLDLRVTILGHIQRGGSPTAADRILAGRMGVRAVDELMSGGRTFMVCQESGRTTVRPISDSWEAREGLDSELLRLCRVLAL